jgi:carbonic anhydrase
MDDVMKKIIEGYKKFYEQYFLNQSLYQKLFEQQKPTTMFIACCDSRVDPALLVSAQPGDIFVERNVANVVPHNQDGPNSILIALDVALSSFGIGDIVVMGHERCAGVEMLAQGKLEEFGHMPSEYLYREKELQSILKVPYDQNTAMFFEKLNVVLSCQNLMSHEMVFNRVMSGDLAIHGWYFSLKTGKFETLCLKCKKFTDLLITCCGLEVV